MKAHGAGNVTINWGDGTQPQTTAGNQVVRHTYANKGYYRVVITGVLSELGGFENIVESRADELVAVSQFGNLGVTSLGYAFARAPNLTRVTQNLPASVDALEGTFSNQQKPDPLLNLSGTVAPASSELGNFRKYDSLAADISAWDTSEITDMSYMFAAEEFFNVDISGWDTSNVTNMEWMFQGAVAFNQDLSSWDVSNVTNMESMFSSALSFQKDLNTWDVSNVTNMDNMFALSNYNGNISGWNLASLKTVNQMFGYLGLANEVIDGIFLRVGVGRTADIANWTFPVGADLTGMFVGADMTGRLINWDVSGVVNMSGMFAVSNFNGNISLWDVGNVTDMSVMFLDASKFNQDLSGWNVTKVYGEQASLAFDLRAVSWTRPRPVFPEPDGWRQVGFGAGTWVAIRGKGPTEQVMRSVDGGSTWTRTAAPENNEWFSVAYGDGTWVAVAMNGTSRVMRSVNGGLTWQSAQAVAPNTWTSVAYGDGVWVAVSADGAQPIIRSTNNGATWTAASLPPGDVSLRSVAFGDGVWVAVDRNVGSTLRSTDAGLTWEIQTNEFPNILLSVGYGNGVWLAVPFDRSALGPGTTTVIRSVDGGVTWQQAGTIPRGAMLSISYGGGVWLATSSSQGGWSSTDNGETWVAVGDRTDLGKPGFGDGQWIIPTARGVIRWPSGV